MPQPTDTLQFHGSLKSSETIFTNEGVGVSIKLVDGKPVVTIRNMNCVSQIDVRVTGAKPLTHVEAHVDGATLHYD